MEDERNSTAASAVPEYGGSHTDRTPKSATMYGLAQISEIANSAIPTCTWDMGSEDAATMRALWERVGELSNAIAMLNEGVSEEGAYLVIL